MSGDAERTNDQPAWMRLAIGAAMLVGLVGGLAVTLGAWADIDDGQAVEIGEMMRLALGLALLAVPVVLVVRERRR